MSAITFIIDTLLSLALFVFLARLILPLRRVLPPMGKIDTASVVALLLVAALEVAAKFALLGAFPNSLLWVRTVLVDITSTLLWTFLYALLSLIAPQGYSPLQSVLAAVCEPVLRPFRRVIPAVAGLDLSPLWAI